MGLFKLADNRDKESHSILKTCESSILPSTFGDKRWEVMDKGKNYGPETFFISQTVLFLILSKQI